MNALTHTGNLGDPTVATREKGAKMVDDAVENIATLVDALAGVGAPDAAESTGD